MSFRSTIFWAVAIAVMVIVALELSFDFVAERVASDQRGRTQARVDKALDDLDQLYWSNELETLINLPNLSGPDVVAMFVVPWGVSRVAIGDPTSFPSEGGTWAHGLRTLSDGTEIRVALPLSRLEVLLADELLLDLLDLPLFLAIAFLTALLLQRRIARPVQALTAATEAIAGQRFPGPVAVPAGKDELSRLALAFNRMSAAVQQQFERERTFTRYASHELRTPLAAMKIQLGRLQLGVSSMEEVSPAMERSLRRMEDTLEALMALARSGQRDPQPQPLGTLLDETLGTLPKEARRALSVQADARAMVTDGPLLRQALHNLLENAVKHGHGPVWLEAAIDGPVLLLKVKDHGPGVAEEDLVRLTEPFFRGGSSRGGLGLGLALVDLIARSVDGDLQFRNTGEGLEVTMRLPIVTEAVA